MGLLLAALLAIGVFHAVTAARSNRLIAAIRAKGEPVTIADLNARLRPIPDDENLALRLSEVVERIEVIEFHSPDAKELPYIGFGDAVPQGARLTSRQTEASKSYNYRNENELGEMHDVLLRLPIGRPMSCWASQIIFQDGWVVRSDLLRASKLCAMQCLLCASEGDAEGFLIWLEAAYHISDALFQDDSLFGMLNTAGIRSLAGSSTVRGLNLLEMSDPDLKKMQHWAAMSGTFFRIKAALETERVVFLDNFQAAMSPTASPNGLSIRGVNFYRWTPGIPALDRQTGLKIYTEIVEAFGEQDEGEGLKRIQQVLAAHQSIPDYCILTRKFLTDPVRAVGLCLREIGSSRALVAGIACERYRLVHGRFPVTLDALVPAFLNCVPADPFDGRPIRYKFTEDGIVVWTIAEDFLDDGGALARKRVKGEYVTQDSGWKILNPELRGRVGTATQPGN